MANDLLHVQTRSVVSLQNAVTNPSIGVNVAVVYL